RGVGDGAVGVDGGGAVGGPGGDRVGGQGLGGLVGRPRGVGSAHGCTGGALVGRIGSVVGGHCRVVALGDGDGHVCGVAAHVQGGVGGAGVADVVGYVPTRRSSDLRGVGDGAVGVDGGGAVGGPGGDRVGGQGLGGLVGRPR